MASHLGLEEVSQSRTIRAAKRFADVIVPPLRWVVKRLPWVHSRIGETLSGRLGKVYSLLEKKQFADAFRVSQEGLARCEAPDRRGVFKEMPEFFWWHFFDCYAHGATGLGEDERAVVLARTARAPGPGRVLEAQCLDTFSRWRWAAGDAAAAIDLARRAIAADADFARFPEFIAVLEGRG